MVVHVLRVSTTQCFVLDGAVYHAVLHKGVTGKEQAIGITIQTLAIRSSEDYWEGKEAELHADEHSKRETVTKNSLKTRFISKADDDKPIKALNDANQADINNQPTIWLKFR